MTSATLKGTRVLVTGANGFLGRVLVARLRTDGASVHALVLPNEPIPDTWNDGVTLFRGDVTSEADVARAAAGTTVVFHLAAIVGDAGDDALHQRVTVGGTRVVATLCASSKARLVLASSIVVYGDRIGREVCDESTPHGRAAGPYSRAKQGQEHVVNELLRSHGLDVVVVRPGNVYGPGSGPWLLDLREVLRTGMPSLIGGGDFGAGLAYVDNVVEIMMRAATSKAARGKTLLAVDGLDVTWRRYFSDIAALVRAPKPRAAPRAVVRALAGPVEDLHKKLGRPGRPPITREAVNLIGSPNDFDNARTRALLEWNPSVDYGEGMKRTAEYVRARGLDR